MAQENIVKTGTTTLAIKCKDGVVLAADKRATAGYLVAHKKVTKILQITPNISVTTAGTVSDIQLMANILKAEISLKDIRSGRTSTVKEVVHLLGSLVYGNIRKFSTIPGVSHFLVAGVDEYGFHIYDVGADGSVMECDDFVSSGSGSVMAYGVLEALCQNEMTTDLAVDVAKKAINSAVQRDVASGNGVDIAVITKEGVNNLPTQELAYKIE